MANIAISQPIDRVEEPAAVNESGSGHLLQRLPSLAAAATLAMLIAMTMGTAISIRSINHFQIDLRFEKLVDSISLEVDAEFNKSLSELAAIRRSSRRPTPFPPNSSAYSLTQLEPVHAGYFKIEKGEVWPLREKAFQRYLATVGGQRSVPGHLEAGMDKFEGIWFVVHDKNPR